MSESCGHCSGEGCEKKPEELKLEKNLSKVKNRIVILSGKGGVGKSTVAVNIAVALSLAGMKVGLLDVDVHGPSIPRLLSLGDKKPHMGSDYMEPVAWSKNLSVMSLGFLLPTPEDAVIWRGPVKMGLIQQFLSDVVWGELDFLIVDCPPGTGDEPLSALQLLGPSAYAVVVTTPQGVAIDDVRRSISFCRQLENPVLGIVENMSGYVCRHCGKLDDIFNSGGGEKLAAEMGVPFLGKIPLDPEVVRSCDEGYPLLKVSHDSETAKAMNKIIKPLLALAGRLQEIKPVGAAMQRVQTALPKDGATRIAVPVAGGELCAHFGHCEKFAMVNVDNKKKTITGQELLTPPAHEPGVLPRWLAEQGADLIIAGGMGSRAQSLFTENGIKVVVGVRGGKPEDVVKAYLQGGLSVGENICDH